MISPTERELITEISQQAVNRAVSLITTSTRRPATVLVSSPDLNVVVQVDGDEDDIQTMAQNLTGMMLEVGQRVMVLFQPPHAVFVTGLITQGPRRGFQDYIPTLVQGVTVAKTQTFARYKKQDGEVHVKMFLSVTGAGTGGQPIVVGVPDDAPMVSEAVLGVGLVWDGVTNNWCHCYVTSNLTFTFYRDQDTLNHTTALAAGHFIHAHIWYETG